jgi:protein SCO1/2
VRQIRIALWALVALVLVAIGVLMLQQRPQLQPASKMTAASGKFGGPFTLVGTDGKPFPSSRLAGKPYALFFGFTHCPDTCPTTLARLVKLRRQAGGDAAFNMVFVTVDPERDGPKQMAAYSSAFGAPIIGLTGSPEQIEQVKKEFGIFSQKVPAGDGDYSVDHTASVLLFDRRGEFVATISPDEQDSPALDKLKRLTAA